MVSLVVVLGAVHGIVLLPVLLSIMGPGACAKEKSPEDSMRSVVVDIQLSTTKGAIK